MVDTIVRINKPFEENGIWVDGFEWDENKRLVNLKKHRIDFYDSMAIFGQFSEPTTL